MAFYLAHSNSDSAVLPRSETPKSFIPAQATARVTTFSFPLFILSGAPPGRLLKPVDCVTAAPGASESHTWKIASPGGVERRTAYPFELPCNRAWAEFTTAPVMRQADFYTFYGQMSFYAVTLCLFNPAKNQIFSPNRQNHATSGTSSPVSIRKSLAFASPSLQKSGAQAKPAFRERGNPMGKSTLVAIH